MTAFTTVNDSWEELQTTALLGTDRRPLPELSGSPALVEAASAVDRTDAATALLELAALEAVRRRAGAVAAEADGLPDPAAPDTRRELPEAAARRLAVLVGGRSGAGMVANLGELLPQWLATARERDYRAPAALVPALLDAARARSELRADTVALTGPLGRWLAAQNPDWRFVTRTAAEAANAPGTPDTPDSDTPDSDTPVDRLWQEGLFAERVTCLTRLRRSDPAAALALLRTTWSTERAEDRVLFLDALAEGLSPIDEPFLEAALSDRSKNVRATAAELLSTLPQSALATRMAERARAAVRLARPKSGADGVRLVVNPPSECDAAMQRDGIPPKSPTGRGERAWWFGEVIAAAPLSLWTTEAGLTPGELLRLPVGDSGPEAESTGEDEDAGKGEGSTPPAEAGSWADDLREGWARAAVRQRDADWARALLGPVPRPGRAGGAAGAPARLLAVLPPAERAAWTAAFIQTHGLGEAFQLLGACATPWTPPLSTAVVAALSRSAQSGAYPWSHSGVLGMTERALAPETAPAVEALAAETAADSAWADTFNRLAATLRFREAMLIELDG
ncbi:DUF5691 domain-containing protein [Kitasatospora sp. GP82]|uniref:DUF5691 domain-containing protein n=1 Tax=Kitasatospora sp. GP82 TaxID=3035089 RepID=UPI00247327AE|nr:DUF5691 domain-containing protein [Kitasatospora sp. GP82]MDH6124211.1 hypothetical protein [Kitasatospora sp. GP82]